MGFLTHPSTARSIDRRGGQRYDSGQTYIVEFASTTNTPCNFLLRDAVSSDKKLRGVISDLFVFASSFASCGSQVPHDSLTFTCVDGTSSLIESLRVDQIGE